MIDSSIRTHERAGFALRQQIRAGELELRHVQFAAWLGYAPALEAAEAVGPEIPDIYSGSEEWCSKTRQVLNWGGLPKPILVRLACEMADRVPHSPEGEAAISAARSWLECPCEDHRHAAVVESEAAGEISFELYLARKESPGRGAEALMLRLEEAAASAAHSAGEAAGAKEETRQSTETGGVAIPQDNEDPGDEDEPVTAASAACSAALSAKRAKVWTVWTQAVQAANALAERAGQAGSEAGKAAAKARATAADAAERAAYLQAAAEAAEAAAESIDWALDQAAESAAQRAVQARIVATRGEEEAKRAMEAEERATKIVQRAIEEHKLAARAAYRVLDEYERVTEGGIPGSVPEALQAADEREANWQAMRLAEVLCCPPIRHSD